MLRLSLCVRVRERLQKCTFQNGCGEICVQVFVPYLLLFLVFLDLILRFANVLDGERIQIVVLIHRIHLKLRWSVE